MYLYVCVIVYLYCTKLNNYSCT